ncbi:hypothetical protein [Tepidibacillus decaturensis]|uniref:Uncharacterized protein n=1 Tax=Tepidibacillus decaturensis TaxID=1413211 RepID=A0A135L111_9BACI|nr:hypothetical protein [Tepidibacillus decaturensis]KXG42691.1 hypothetical protein U473_00495 [Tepidibacillus decaturensis]
MDYDEKVLSRQYPVVKDFVYHYIAYRELNNAYKEFTKSTDFWIFTMNAHLLQAAICWCMVFGSDRSNPIHWKNLNINEKDNLSNWFRSELTEYLNIDEEEWESYWKSMVTFRNRFVAHRELTFQDPVPYFETAYKVALFYDQWVRKIVYPDLFDLIDLEEVANKFRVQTSELVERVRAGI